MQRKTVLIIAVMHAKKEAVKLKPEKKYASTGFQPTTTSASYEVNSFCALP